MKARRSKLWKIRPVSFSLKSFPKRFVHADLLSVGVFKAQKGVCSISDVVTAAKTNHPQVKRAAAERVQILGSRKVDAVHQSPLELQEKMAKEAK